LNNGPIQNLYMAIFYTGLLVDNFACVYSRQSMIWGNENSYQTFAKSLLNFCIVSRIQCSRRNPDMF
jgi:hypothetical protein